MLKLFAKATYQAVNKLRQPACLMPVCEKHCILFLFITWTSKRHHRSADSQWRAFEKAHFKTDFWTIILDFVKEFCQTDKLLHLSLLVKGNEGMSEDRNKTVRAGLKIKPLMLSALRVIKRLILHTAHQIIMCVLKKDLQISSQSHHFLHWGQYYINSLKPGWRLYSKEMTAKASGTLNDFTTLTKVKWDAKGGGGLITIPSCSDMKINNARLRFCCMSRQDPQ